MSKNAHRACAALTRDTQHNLERLTLARGSHAARQHTVRQHTARQHAARKPCRKLAHDSLDSVSMSARLGLGRRVVMNSMRPRLPKGRPPCQSDGLREEHMRSRESAPGVSTRVSTRCTLGTHVLEAAAAATDTLAWICGQHMRGGRARAASAPKFHPSHRKKMM